MSAAPERNIKRGLAGVMVALGAFIGSISLLYNMVYKPITQSRVAGGTYLASLVLSLYIALPAFIVIMRVPRMVDRYTPEPIWMILGAVIWGAIVVTGVGHPINETIAGWLTDPGVGPHQAKVILSVWVAPVVEESLKCFGLVAMAILLSDDFENVVDGFCYAIIIAISFALVENVYYYNQHMAAGSVDKLISTFGTRGLVSPWIHPVFTAGFGLALGYAREKRSIVHYLFLLPLGFGVSVVLHMIWNWCATNAINMAGHVIFNIAVVVYIAIIAGLAMLGRYLVRRETTAMRETLTEEVEKGVIAPEHVEILANPDGRRLSEILGVGSSGQRFFLAAVDLGFFKWNMAKRGQTETKAHPDTLAELQAKRDTLARARSGFRQVV